MFEEENMLWRLTVAFSLAAGIVADTDRLIDLLLSSWKLLMEQPAESAAIAVVASVMSGLFFKG